MGAPAISGRVRERPMSNERHVVTVERRDGKFLAGMEQFEVFSEKLEDLGQFDGFEKAEAFADSVRDLVRRNNLNVGRIRVYEIDRLKLVHDATHPWRRVEDGWNVLEHGGRIVKVRHRFEFDFELDFNGDKRLCKMSPPTLWQAREA